MQRENRHARGPRNLLTAIVALAMMVMPVNTAFAVVSSENSLRDVAGGNVKTETLLLCLSSVLDLDASTHVCTATVTFDSVPTGTPVAVVFKSGSRNDSSEFSPPTCNLTVAGLTRSCSTRYTAPVAPGLYDVKAEYHGDVNTNSSNSTFSVTVSALIPLPPLDTTKPTIIAVLSGTAGSNGWYRSAVGVDFQCADAGSGIASCGPDVTLSAQGPSAATGIANDIAGNSSSPLVMNVKIDTIAPTITFTGNTLTYDVDQTVAITCTAADQTGGSGLASSNCTGASGPAYTFPLSSTTLTGTATDIAGNTGSGSTTFTVKVTATGLCNLTKTFASKPLGSSLCAQLNAAAAAKARGNTQAAGNATAAYVREVQAQTGKAFTLVQAAVLIRLVGGL